MLYGAQPEKQQLPSEICTENEEGGKVSAPATHRGQSSYFLISFDSQEGIAHTYGFAD
jgi:hypothetical protein